MIFCSTTKDGARDRNRTGTTVRSRDFKSLVSTSFTTRAEGARQSCKKQTGIGDLEAEVGIEPAYTELQSAA